MSRVDKQIEERMNIVIVGHVDHGKSTLVGRLMVDTGSLPEGKLDQVRRSCEQNARPFEYAFLLDALEDEQSQGITIDTARIFFKSQKREYIIIDAPGHIEFLKNMISGAARAEAAVLLIDAYEGIAENSRRHAYMLSLLGIKQVVVAVNKMDLVDYDQDIFNKIEREYRAFLATINIIPISFVPVSAIDGVNIVSNQGVASWYQGQAILEEIDDLSKALPLTEQVLRLPVQDVYKFTADKDDRRIIAGTICSGSINVGDEVVFLPSGKTSKVVSIEGFNEAHTDRAIAGKSTGITLDTQIYVKPGEIICKVGDDSINVADRFRANVFWMGKKPLETGKSYKLKLANSKVDVVLESVESVLDASTLNKGKRPLVEKHEVAECIFRTYEPIAFDIAGDIEATSRFVLVDDYDIAGGAIIIEKLESADNTVADNISEFELEFNALVRKHFPHWEAKDVSLPLFSR